MKDEQEKVFRDGEGDAWYRRNREHLHEQRDDWMTRMVAALEDKSAIKRVAELGCANGWRLARLRPLFAQDCLFAGVDASAEAIADGRRRFPELQLSEGVLSDLPLEQGFDLVIVNFVLHWADRDSLARCIAEIDRLVNWNGYLAIGDFLPDFPTRRRYHHLPQQSVFTYKQDYARAFLGLGFYREMARITFDHARMATDLQGQDWIAPIDADARAATSLLHKSPQSYAER
jgi:SAM-dependent methyltransferase